MPYGKMHRLALDICLSNGSKYIQQISVFINRYVHVRQKCMCELLGKKNTFSIPF